MGDSPSDGLETKLTGKRYENSLDFPALPAAQIQQKMLHGD